MKIKTLLEQIGLFIAYKYNKYKIKRSYQRNLSNNELFKLMYIIIYYSVLQTDFVHLWIKIEESKRFLYPNLKLDERIYAYVLAKICSICSQLIFNMFFY